MNLNNSGVNTLTSATNLNITPNTNNVGTLGSWDTTSSLPQQISAAPVSVKDVLFDVYSLLFVKFGLLDS